MKKAVWMSILLIASLAPPALPKRGGGGGFSMGRSSGGRGSSAARSSSGGGVFGGSRTSSSGGGGFGMSHGTGQKSGSGGWGGSGHQTSHNTGGGHSGGHNSGGNWNPKHTSGSGGWGRGHTSTYTKGNGVGSVFRSNSFKNAIVGAAAGYLTYQAGKAIIRSVTHPMMWGGRSYYWGQNYYQPRHGQTNMCRMPLESSDQQFGNVYFQDNTRPREIVWGCGFNEHCCGYECCRNYRPGGASGFGLPAGIGGLLFAAFVLCCFLPLALKYFQMARMVRV